MLRRILSVVGIGRFAGFLHKGVELSRLTLVYAPNGNGKSTLSDLLRSLSENDNKVIARRKRLSSSLMPEVQLNFDDGQFKYTNGKWTDNAKTIQVFDDRFVSENVYIDSGVSRENKRNLFRIIIGKEGIQKQVNFDDLSIEQSNAREALRIAENQLQAKIQCRVEPKTIEILRTPIPENVEILIAEVQRELNNARNSELINNTSQIGHFPETNFDEIVNSLTKSVSDIASDTVFKFESHLKKHLLSDEDVDWLKKGLEHRGSGDCPFCDQDLAGSSFINLLESYFSDQFNALRTDISYHLAAVEQHLEHPFLGDDDSDWNQKKKFWSGVVTLPQWDEKQTREGIRLGLLEAKELLNAKLADPLQQIDVGCRQQTFSAASEAVIRLDNWIKDANQLIKEQKERTEQSHSRELEQRLKELTILKARLDPNVGDAVREYLKLYDDCKNIEQRREISKEELRNFSSQKAEGYTEKLNEFLGILGARFRIVGITPNYRGKSPNADFAVAIDDSHVDVGEANESEPSFNTLLSAGDKNTLGLSIFLADLAFVSEADAADRILVLDDPFGSQDKNRRLSTACEIRKLAHKFRQVIVFSHDVGFLILIERDATKNQAQLFELCVNDEGKATFTQKESAKLLSKQYGRDWDEIFYYAKMGEFLECSSPMSVLRAIRPFLEAFIKAVTFDDIGDNKSFSTLIDRIKENPHHLLYEKHEQLTELNENTRSFHHGEGNDIQEMPNDEEVRELCKRVVALVGATT